MIKPDNGQRSAKLGNCLIWNWPRMVEQSFVSIVVWWMIDQSLIIVSARVISIDVISGCDNAPVRQGKRFGTVSGPDGGNVTMTRTRAG
jgi:hypothetical protein